MGAKRYVNVNNAEEMKGHNNSFDFIISTFRPINRPLVYARMLKYDKRLKWR